MIKRVFVIATLSCLFGISFCTHAETPTTKPSTLPLANRIESFSEATDHYMAAVRKIESDARKAEIAARRRYVETMNKYLQTNQHLHNTIVGNQIVATRQRILREINRLLDGSSNFLIPPPVHSTDAVPFNGHWFALLNGPVTWHIAEDACEKTGGHLATITSLEKDTFIRKLSGGKDVWLGGNNEEKDSHWVWVTGEPFEYKDWAPGQPDNYLGSQHNIFYWNGRGWDDHFASARMGYICEWDQ